MPNLYNQYAIISFARSNKPQGVLNKRGVGEVLDQFLQ